MTRSDLRIDIARLLARLKRLAEIGAIEGGGNARLALTDQDKAGRDLVVSWMKALGLAVTVDAIGNVFAVRKGRGSGSPVMTGSHIDTVRTGGRYDGNYGVLAGLEVVETLNQAGIETGRPIAVAFFTNEEGARFQPDMMGSLVHVGGHPGQEVFEHRRVGSGRADCVDPDVERRELQSKAFDEADDAVFGSRIGGEVGPAL